MNLANFNIRADHHGTKKSDQGMIPEGRPRAQSEAEVDLG